jgi:RNA polymerase sigma-70 factor, ECF subfamily
MITTEADFEHRAAPFRREILAHCYQLLGSAHDAEDLTQETMLRAWRARGQFDERKASLRTWLYRIATNACLTALAGRVRRPLPAGLGQPGGDPREPLRPGGEVPWLQPLPDALVAPAGAGRDPAASDPAAALLARGALRLALVAAMQQLPPRQRAVLILRDVLDLPAAEAAGILDTTTAAVNSALQRARLRMAAAGLGQDQVSEPADPAARDVIDRYAAAFEAADVAGLTRLLAADAVLEMPPMLNWYAGRDDYAAFIVRVFETRGTDWRLLAAAANGQPAIAAYARGNGAYHLHSLQVFAVSGGYVTRNTTYADPALAVPFGLPADLPA